MVTTWLGVADAVNWTPKEPLTLEELLRNMKETNTGLRPAVNLISMREYRKKFPNGHAWWWRVRNRRVRCNSRAVKTYLKRQAKLWSSP